MPRQIGCGLDYDDDYDDYGGYDYDYEDDDHDREQDGIGSSRQEAISSGRWRCSICSYDNDGSMIACDICGVLRYPLAANGAHGNNRTVEGMRKDAGVSKLAKSLFASLQQHMPKKGVLLQKHNGDCVRRDRNSFHLQFPEFHNGFGSQSNRHVKIVPFKFNIPSPDDLVINRLHSSKMGSKAKLNNLETAPISSSIKEKNGMPHLQSKVEKPDSSSLSTPKGKHSNSVDSNVPDRAVETEINKNMDQSSALIPTANGTKSYEELLGGGASSLRKGKKRLEDVDSSIIEKEKSRNLTTSLKDTTLDVRSENPKNGNTKGSSSQVTYKPEKWMLPQDAEDKLTQLNLAVVGHVDSGKSSLSGRLLKLLGRISQKEMHKYEKEAKLKGKGSFAYAWALDESTEERERGITMTVAVAYFDSKKYHVVVLDSPGHQDFVPNMISGAMQADTAILVIDASVGSFEAGMDGSKGQTKEHAQLVRSFGVDQIIIAVNKMDVVAYAKDRFDLMKQQLGAFLRSCGFKDGSVSWIPVSAMENQNLVAAPSDVRLRSWYHGQHLLDAIDSLQPPARDYSKPLLMPVCDVVRSTPLGQICACGKLETGALRTGSKVLVMPSSNVCTVRSLERDSQACAIARAGDNVAVTLQGIDANQVMAGYVLCHPDFPVAVSKHLEVKVLILDVATPILIGSQLELHIHHAKEAARVSKILSILDPKTGKVTKKSPRCLTSKQSAIVEVILQAPVCVEEFSKSRALGRVFLRTSGRTIGVGVVTDSCCRNTVAR